MQAEASRRISGEMSLHQTVRMRRLDVVHTPRDDVVAPYMTSHDTSTILTV